MMCALSVIEFLSFEAFSTKVCGAFDAPSDATKLRFLLEGIALAAVWVLAKFLVDSEALFSSKIFVPLERDFFEKRR